MRGDEHMMNRVAGGQQIAAAVLAVVLSLFAGGASAGEIQSLSWEAGGDKPRWIRSRS
jgi:4-diphosphocytidyl-2C-methyl-D-erythritol kinase